MGRGFQALLENPEYANQIELDEGLGIEPEARKNFALKDASGVRLDALEPTLALDEPVDRFFLGTPDDVFLDSVPQVKPELGVQVDTLAARRDLANEFRSSGDVKVVVDIGLTTVRGEYDQSEVGLGNILEVELEGSVIAGLSPWGVRQKKPSQVEIA